MNMELSTGVVRPKAQPRTLDNPPKKYDVQTLVIIIRAFIKTGRVIDTIGKNPPPQKGWAKVWYWIKSLFANRAVFAEIGQDVAQIYNNALRVKQELLDLDGDELEFLLDFVIGELGISQPKALEYVRVVLPALLDAAQKFAFFHSTPSAA